MSQRKPPLHIKTAAEWQKELRNLNVNGLDDVRDDVISLVRNSGLTFKEVEGRGGATAGTLYRWEDRKVKNPQFRTLRDTLHAIGKDFYVGAKLK